MKGATRLTLRKESLPTDLSLTGRTGRLRIDHFVCHATVDHKV
jgi:hypothetical protein